jgi:hypothetical protein
VPPAPGRMARRVSGRPTTAVEAKTRRWVHRASSRPPPRAGAASAAMVGIGRAASAAKVERRVVRNCVVLTRRSGGLVGVVRVVRRRGRGPDVVGARWGAGGLTLLG